MNLFDKVYDIRLANLDEADAVMSYISEDWKEGHIMSVNKELFSHEYNTFNNGKLNVMIAVRKDNRQIDGMLGFIPASENSEKLDMWGSIWKTRRGSVMFLGNEIMKRLLEEVKCRNYAAVGINMDTTGKLVHKTINAYTGRMKHWYILNSSMEYHIAAIKERKTSVPINSDIEIREAYTIDELDRFFDFGILENEVPYKDRWYINRRFFNYPINRYQVYLAGGDNKADALLVMREVAVNGSKIIRIVDFLGNRKRLKYLGRFLVDLMHKKNYEYVDFYENGFCDSDMIDAGFVERKEGDINIIPNYFAPFVQQNVEIFFHAPNKDFVLCKADGDQDRPN